MKIKVCESSYLRTIFLFALIFASLKFSYGQLDLPPKFKEGIKIKSISVRTYEIGEADTLDLSSAHTGKADYSKSEFYNREGNLIKKEFFKNGVLSNSSLYIYNNGRLAEEVYDTSLNARSNIRKEYIYYDDLDYVDINLYRKNGEITYWRYKNDKNGNTLMEATLDSNRVPISHTSYLYNYTDGLPRIVSNFRGDSLQNEHIYLFDKKGEFKKKLIISSNGKIIKSTSYEKVNEFEMKIIDKNELTEEIKESKHIFYRNADGNMHKSCLLSHRRSKKWRIKEYVYTYYN